MLWNDLGKRRHRLARVDIAGITNKLGRLGRLGSTIQGLGQN
jgi:hypothetical protein